MIGHYYSGIKIIEFHIQAKTETSEDEQMMHSCKSWVSMLPGSLADMLASLRQQQEVEVPTEKGAKARSKVAGLIKVAELILDKQPILLQQAMDVYSDTATEVAKPTNATKFGEFLCRRLPVELFSASRKEGTWLMERMDDKYPLIRQLALTRRMKIDPKDGLPVEEYRKLERMMEPSEKDFCRYLLSQIYGVEEASKRYGFTNLESIVEKVSAVKMKAAESTTLKSKAAIMKAVRTPLKNPPRGGKVAWESSSPETLEALKKNVLANV